MAQGRFVADFDHKVRDGHPWFIRHTTGRWVVITRFSARQGARDFARSLNGVSNISEDQLLQLWPLALRARRQEPAQ